MKNLLKTPTIHAVESHIANSYQDTDKQKLRLLVDETIFPVANVNKARTQRIKSFTFKYTIL